MMRRTFAQLVLTLCVMIPSTSGSSRANDNSRWRIVWQQAGYSFFIGGVPYIWPLTYEGSASGFVGFSAPGVGTATVRGMLTPTFEWVGPGSPPEYINYYIGVTGNMPAPNGSRPRSLTDSFGDRDRYVFHSDVNMYSMDLNGGKVFTKPVNSQGRAFGEAVSVNGSSNDPDVSNVYMGVSVDVLEVSVRGVSTGNEVQLLAPEFLSGTNCKVEGWIDLPSFTGGCSSVILKVNGQKLNGWVYTPPSVDGFLVSAAFDSTHFPHNSPVTLSIVAKDGRGHDHTAQDHDIVYNKAFTMENINLNGYTNYSHDLTDFVRRTAQQMNYLTNGAYLDFNVAAMKQAVTEDTLFFAASHGNIDELGDSWSVGGDGATKLHKPETEYQIGQKEPGDHFIYPSFNFVMLNACESAGHAGSPYHATFAHEFNIWSGIALCVDRAFVGWNGMLNAGIENEAVTKTYWQHLLKGDTVTGARYRDVPVGRKPVPDSLVSDKGQLPVVVGDKATKVHGVYGKLGTDWR